MYQPWIEEWEEEEQYLGLPPRRLCENRLIISSKDGELLDRMFQETKGLDFNRIIPYPDHLSQLDAKWRKWHQAEFQLSLEEHRPMKRDGPKPAWDTEGMDWCQQHWGTKSGALHIASKAEDSKRIITFDTMFTPPILVVEALGKKYPDIVFRLEYVSKDFQGTLVVEKGQTIEREEMARS
jgi:hypothetical protein